MRKVDPNAVIDDFKQQASAGRSTWQQIHQALPQTPVSLRRKVAGDAFLTLAVGWESFFSDWWTGAINRDASTFLATTERRLRERAKEDFGLEQADLAPQLVSRAHLSVAEVRRRMDPQERNVVIHGHQARKRRSQLDLAGDYRARAHAIVAGDWQAIECTRGMRNLLAHRSPSARDSLDQVIRKANLDPSLRWTGQRKLSVAGTLRHLASKRPTDAELRVARLHTLLSDIAEQLRVP